MTAGGDLNGTGTVLRHPALFYRDLYDFVSSVGEFVLDGIARDEPVFVAVPGQRVDALRDALGEMAGGASYADMTDLGRNPGRILSRLHDFAGRHSGRRVRIVGEPIWPGRSPAETQEGVRHEALINLAFGRASATILCPYDATGLDPAVLADAERTHPLLLAGGIYSRSFWYAEPAEVCGAIDRLPLPEWPAAEAMTVTIDSMSDLRAWVTGFLAQSGLHQDRADQFLLAIYEAATNSIEHGGGGGTVRVWRELDAVVAEVSDAGRLVEPLAGRLRPTPEARSGRGLWLIHQLCDLVQIRSVDNGLILRLHLRYHDEDA